MNLHEEFFKLYEEGLYDSNIALKLNRSFSRISQIRRSYNLPRNFKFNRKNFLELYNKGLNDNEIGEKLNVSGSRISEYRRTLNILSNKSKTIEITKEQEQIIIGTVLGDGHLYDYKYTSMLKFDHSDKQKEYIFYKYNFLKNLCKREPYFLSQLDKRSGKTYYKYSFRTMSYISLKKYRDLFYYPKKKITKELCSLLEPLAIAIYFMDDGYYHNYNQYISMCAYDNESIENFRELLKNKWDIESTIHKGNVLYIMANSTEKFINLIKPYIIDSMKYKLSPYKIG